MSLNERQLRYGFDYFFRGEPRAKGVVELSEYNGEDALTINCTQLGEPFTPQFSSSKDKKRILNEWCDFLRKNSTCFKELSFGTRMPQELFDAVCCQRNLVKLHIKWGFYKDLSAIENLDRLELLHIGYGAGVEGIAPLAKLACLVGLSIENFQKITDYSPLSSLNNVESLSIEGDGMGPRFIKIESLEFLRKMKQLRFLRILTARLKSKDYTPILELGGLEHLTLGSQREVVKIADQLRRLPRLKWGLIKERPELYEK